MTFASALWKRNPSLMVHCPGGARCRRRMTALPRRQALDRTGPLGLWRGSRRSGMGGAAASAFRRPATRHGPRQVSGSAPGHGVGGAARDAAFVAMRDVSRADPWRSIPTLRGVPGASVADVAPAPSCGSGTGGANPGVPPRADALRRTRRGGSPGPGPRRRWMDGRMTRVPCPRDWPHRAAISGRMQVTRIDARWTGERGRRRAAFRSATAGRVAPPLAFGSRHPDPPRRTCVPRGAEPTLR